MSRSAGSLALATASATASAAASATSSASAIASASAPRTVAGGQQEARRSRTFRSDVVIALEVVREARRRVLSGSCPCGADSVAVLLGAARSRLDEIEVNPERRARIGSAVESLLADR